MAFQLAKITVAPGTGERRYATRRTLSLGTIASADPSSWRAVIHDISETGLRIETAIPLEIGDTIEVELPGPQNAVARVVWTEDSTHGCEFVTPISRGAVSAALLRSPADLGQAELPFAAAEPAWQEQDFRPKETSDGAAMIAMLATLVVVALFIYALLALPFSAEQW